MALQLLTPDLTKKSCPPEPTRCNGEFTASVNLNETVTLWKSAEPIKGTFYLRVNAGGTPVGAVAIFEIKESNGTIISRNIPRGTAYALTTDKATQITVQVTNGPPDQTALIFFMYCSQETIISEASEEKCCSPALTCDDFSDTIGQWDAEPLFTWETFFPVKGTLEFIFRSTFNPVNNPSATIEVERFTKPDLVRTIPLNLSNTDSSDVPFVLTVDDINKVTVTSTGIDTSNSSVNFLLCHQEENISSCCDEPLKCEGSFQFAPLAPAQDIKIWESVIPVKGTYSITSVYEGTVTVNIQFNNNKTLQKTLSPGGGFAITSKDIKDITIRINPSPSPIGGIEFRYCVQDMLRKNPCKSSCCPKPLPCDVIRAESFNNPQGKNIPIWISKIPVEGEIVFSIEGQPQQRAEIIIKRFGKSDIVRTIEGERIFTVRTTNLEGVSVQLNNGDPGDNAIRLVLCIQEQISQKNTESKNYSSKKIDCCPETVKCELDPNLLIINTVELPLNRDIVLWESTELIKGNFSIRNASLTEVDMTVKIRYKDGHIDTRILRPSEGFMITAEGIVSLSVRFSSTIAEARGQVVIESCTQNILEKNKNNLCCPQPLICQFLSTEATGIPGNQNYLLWHAGFPVKAMIEILQDAIEPATLIIERYNENTITETLPTNSSRILVVDHIKNVFINMNSELGTERVVMEICMQEELPLKGDENLCHSKC
ncbi:S-Ena type endospore appendage [Defluviitalea saccharophila]|uniref:Uncharacterized protein n=1 Tax=Defluviitalea saccharophila TaxID=879970 RepID=A0ABZ2Y5W7_9FIRM